MASQPDFRLRTHMLVRAAEALIDGDFGDAKGVIAQHAVDIAELPREERDAALTWLLAGHEAAGLDVGLMPRNAKVFAQGADAWIRDAVSVIDTRGGLTTATA